MKLVCSPMLKEKNLLTEYSRLNFMYTDTKQWKWIGKKLEALQHIPRAIKLYKNTG